MEKEQFEWYVLIYNDKLTKELQKSFGYCTEKVYAQWPLLGLAVMGTIHASLTNISKHLQSCRECQVAMLKIIKHHFESLQLSETEGDKKCNQK